MKEEALYGTEAYLLYSSVLYCAAAYRAPSRPGNPVPLVRYRDLVDRLQFAIATGRLAPGTLLPSLREGADEYGVHLHTVRRAYHELAELGLVRVDPRRGTVVLPAGDAAADTGLDGFLRRTLAEAERRFGADATEVADALARIRGTTATASVAECSRTLAASLARQIALRWRVTVTPRLIGAEPPPPGPVISTYFHFREVTAALVERPDDASFVHIALAKRLLATLRRAIRAGTLRRIVICETDGPLGHEVAGALRHALRAAVEIEVLVPRSVTRIVGRLAAGQWALISPQHWDRLDPALPLPERALLLDYDVDPADLDALGAARGWKAR